MSANLILIVVAGVLVAAGVYLLLERSMTRILVGVLLASNGVNILFLVASGAAGGAPIIGTTAPEKMSDPLPQAMVLTAIVITLGMSAFLLTLAYRSFQLHGHDEVADDVEDARIRQLAVDDLASQSYEQGDTSIPDEEGRRLDRPEDEDGDAEGSETESPAPESSETESSETESSETESPVTEGEGAEPSSTAARPAGDRS